MSEATDTFAELTRQGHQVFTAAVQAWEQAARSIAGAAGPPGTQPPDVSASVGAAFDFAAQMLAGQREFTRTLMTAGAQAFAAAAQQPVAAAGTDIAAGSEGEPAQDADQPGAAMPDPVVPPAPTAPAATRPTATKTPAARTTAATKTAAGPAAATKKRTAAATKTAAGPAPTGKQTATTAKKTTATKPATTTRTPAKRAARRTAETS
jgi:hypothetical protein